MVYKRFPFGQMINPVKKTFIMFENTEFNVTDKNSYGARKIRH